MPRRTEVDPLFPTRLRQLRVARGLFQQDLATAAFVSKSHISELENGVKTPGVATARALDNALAAAGELAGMVREAPPVRLDGRHETSPERSGRPGTTGAGGPTLADDDVTRFRLRMREIRQKRGLSLRDLERPTLSSKSKLHKIETGVSNPNEETARLIDAALDAKGELAAMVHPSSPATIAVEKSRDNVAPAGVRANVQTGLALTGPPAPSAQVRETSEWSYAMGTERGWAAMLHWAVPSDAITDTAATFEEALPRRSLGPIDPRLIECMLSAAEGYRRSYHAVPASYLLPAAVAHLDLVMSLRPAELPGRERTVLITAAGEMATLVGVLLALDASRYRDAVSYLDLAWSAARSTGDLELQAVVLGCRSFAISYGEGDHRAGLECVDFAREVAAAGACPETRAWVAAVASERCASLGDVAGCRRRLDESESALSQPDTVGVGWRGIGGYDAGKLRAYEGGDLIRLRRYREAEPILSNALTRLDPRMVRHRATVLLDRAEARAGVGEFDGACDDAGQALGLVSHVQHTGHLYRIESLALRGARAGSRAARSLHRDLNLMKIDHGLSIRIGAG